MNENKKVILFFLFMLSAYVVFPFELNCEFYKYIDKDGNVCFVDDESKIPAEYLDNRETYKEKYDHLSEKEKSLALEEERKELERIREKEDDWLAEEKKKKEHAARERYLKSLVTKVAIQGNKVLVPVTLSYGGKEIEVLLVLDTGAELTVVHQEVADQLYIDQSKRIKVQVAGGKLVGAQLARISYIRAGPHMKKDIGIIIVKHKGPPVMHDGLLGMNFLRNLEYSIDFDNHVIRWKPLP